MTWRWKNCGFPHVGQEGGNDDDEEVCMDEDFAASLENVAAKYSDFNRNCDPKVAPTRPIPFSDDSVIFELKDGRLAEMRRVEGTHWVWSRTIGTPTTSCMANYWTAVTS
ncbi:hypothetical protein OIU77_016950 [Salix suchowensis]|nr:hypothetical protein OIU77_016950 [Salix suchowensis]KAJ6315579.1 hypothetical protein OIU78_018953 [Salix suchowensis]